MSSESEILIFKTNLVDSADVDKVSALLNHHESIRRWNVDVQDIDHVLRVEGQSLDPELIIQTVTSIGYNCEELPD
jgi:hypothetical protein